MFTSTRVPMVLGKANLRIVKDDRGVEHRVAVCALTVDPFEFPLASELGLDVASMFYTDDQQIRPELERVVLHPNVPQQMAHVLAAPDLKDATAKLRNVDVLALGVRVETDKDGVERWLVANVQVRFGLSEREHREFLAAKFGDKLWITWSPEQRPLEFEDGRR